MSSSGFSSTNFGRSCILQYKKIRCRCNKLADIKISGTDRNPFKLFYACKEKEKEEDCGFFDWAHPIGCPCHDKSSGPNGDEFHEVTDVAKVVRSLEARLVSVEDDLTKTMIHLAEIKNLTTSSRNMFTTMLFLVVVIFFLVLLK
jgi:hypothetical protein